MKAQDPGKTIITTNRVRIKIPYRYQRFMVHTEDKTIRQYAEGDQVDITVNEGQGDVWLLKSIKPVS